MVVAQPGTIMLEPLPFVTPCQILKCVMSILRIKEIRFRISTKDLYCSIFQ